jgi:hypothetical protein
MEVFLLTPQPEAAFEVGFYAAIFGTIAVRSPIDEVDDGNLRPGEKADG